MTQVVLANNVLRATDKWFSEGLLIQRARDRKYRPTESPVFHYALAFCKWVKSAHDRVPLDPWHRRAGPGGTGACKPATAGGLINIPLFVRDPMQFSVCATALKEKYGEEYRQLTIHVFHEVLVLKHLKWRLIIQQTQKNAIKKILNGSGFALNQGYVHHILTELKFIFASTFSHGKRFFLVEKIDCWPQQYQTIKGAKLWSKLCSTVRQIFLSL